jgi:hypothetical protein
MLSTFALSRAPARDWGSRTCFEIAPSRALRSTTRCTLVLPPVYRSSPGSITERYYSQAHGVEASRLRHGDQGEKPLARHAAKIMPMPRRRIPILTAAPFLSRSCARMQLDVIDEDATAFLKELTTSSTMTDTHCVRESAFSVASAVIRGDGRRDRDGGQGESARRRRSSNFLE